MAFVYFTRLPLGGFGGLVFILAVGAGPFAAALVALAVTTLITGGFQEDGLADTLGAAIFDRERLR